MGATAGRWWAPGRVNLIGEHTDYNDGYVLPLALPLGMTCTAKPRTDGVVRLASRQVRDQSIDTRVETIVAGGWSELPAWTHYPLGVLAEFDRRGHPVTGVELDLDGTVPVGAGLSSSAALSCAVALALRDLFAPTVTDTDIIDIARAAENDYAGVPTGTLDQSAAMLCTAGHLLFLDTRTGAFEQIPFDLDAFDLALLVLDTGSPHRLLDGEYARRRAECAAAAAQLNVASLRDVTSPTAADRLTDPLLRRRARHVITENARVLRIAEQLRSGADPRAIGPLLTEGHASLRDDFEVSAPRLDLAVDAALAAGAYGARLTGGGFGGSVIALVDRDRIGAVLSGVREAFAANGFESPRNFTVTPSAGAHRIRSAKSTAS
ncbi:galactokinase [Nocardia yunnanensis]|uniref:Galactokinase n=1 Tax=Nocardia yunnanensis TaxID=2382165 RepID=A0A386ZPI4_9NOCA|nr:galactokinase [Nocardia yunnanensis]AYF79497.1 galactokinase [Nocardia yunnanensis]